MSVAHVRALLARYPGSLKGLNRRARRRVRRWRQAMADPLTRAIVETYDPEDLLVEPAW